MSLQAASTDDDDGAYSNPIELMKGMKQKKQATLERQKLGKVAGTPAATFFSPQHHTLRYSSNTPEKLDSKKTLSLEDILRNESALEGDYASVQDAVRNPLSPDMMVSVVPQPQGQPLQSPARGVRGERGKSPSMSPPPVPRRADHHPVGVVAAAGGMNGIPPGLPGRGGPKEIEEVEVEDPNAMYATVQKPTDKRNSLNGKGRGYDRLLDTQDSRGYDHLLPYDHSDDGLDSDTPIEAYATVDDQGHGINPPIEAYATVDDRGHGVNPPIEAYATVDNRGHGINPPIEAYATVDERGHGEAYATVDERGNGDTDQMYATIDITSKVKRKKPHPKAAKAPPKIPPRRDSKLTSVPPTAPGESVERSVAPRGKSSPSPKMVARTPPPMSSQSPLLTQQKIISRSEEHQQPNGGPLYSPVQKPSRFGHKRHASADNVLNNQVQFTRGNKVPLRTHHHNQMHQHQKQAANNIPTSDVAADMYATVQKTTQPKPALREKPHPPPKRVVTPPDQGALYSVPDRKSKKPPPPTAPKPRGRQTPSPQGHGEWKIGREGGRERGRGRGEGEREGGRRGVKVKGRVGRRGRDICCKITETVKFNTYCIIAFLSSTVSPSLLSKYRTRSFDADHSLASPSLLPNMEVRSNRSMSTGGRRAKTSLTSPEPVSKMYL